MKIAQVCPYDFSRPGGVKSHILSLSKCLTKLGHDVKIIAPNIHSEKDYPFPIHYFGKSRSLSLGGTKIDLNVATGTELKGLKEFLNKESFDIIHFHTIWNPALPFQVLFNSRSKNVATFHDTPKNKFIGKTVMPFMARMIFPLLDQVISVSESQSKYISRFSKRKIQIIPNGIDLPEYPINNISKRENTLLFLGRLEPRKGLLHALEVFKYLQPNFSELTFKIAGDGDGREEADNYVRSNNLKKVEFLGFVNEEQKIHLLQISKILLAPSLYGESFGIVLLEAMANGLPISGYGNEGYLNVLTEKQKEYFPVPGNVKELSHSVEQLLLNPELRDGLTNEGLTQAKQYDWEMVAKKIEAVYQEALK